MMLRMQGALLIWKILYWVVAIPIRRVLGKIRIIPVRHGIDILTLI